VQEIEVSTLLRLTVLTPDRVLLAVDSATKVRMKLADDVWLSVYPNHAPLIAEILPGPLQYDTDAESGEVSIAEGILQVTEGQVTVLTSGHQRGTQVPETTDTAETDAASDQKFDRLAAQLLMSLQAQPESASAEDVSAEDVSVDTR
jgi:F0F1-type ATP synthase epsilon subunit